MNKVIWLFAVIFILSTIVAFQYLFYQRLTETHQQDLRQMNELKELYKQEKMLNDSWTEVRKTYQVTFTAFNPVRWQTDSTPWLTATGDSVNHQTIALSRDLVQHYNSRASISFSDTVYAIIPLEVSDIMHRRWQQSADILTYSLVNAKQFGRRSGWLLHFDTRNKTHRKKSANYVVWSKRKQ